MFFRKMSMFWCIGMMFLMAGCTTNTTHPVYKVGQVYETKIDSYVLFEYATFIWQDPRNYQKKGILIPFHPWPAYKEDELPIKEKKEMELEYGRGPYKGGWTIYIPIGSQFEITRIYLTPGMDRTVVVETRFPNGETDGRIVRLSGDFAWSEFRNGIKQIR